MRSFVCSSPSELDQAFFGERNPLSSLDQLSTSNDTTANRSSEGRLASLTSLCQVSDLASPCPTGDLLLQVNPFAPRTQPASGGLVSWDGRVSTPYVLHPKHQSFEQSLVDHHLSLASQPPWDVSFIKPDSQPYVESTTTSLEATSCAARLHSAPLSLLESPSPIWQDPSAKRV
ncbi:unnamed protein product [Merluccius merluccius]